MPCRGIKHAEFNLESEATELFQIWIEPSETRLEPAWATKEFPKEDRAGQIVPLASGRPGHDEALPINQDAAILGLKLHDGEEAVYPIGADRRAYLVVAEGSAEINGLPLNHRDAAAISKEADIRIVATADAEIVLADLP